LQNDNLTNDYIKNKTMKKAEQLKQQQREIKAKTLSETLLQLSEQHKNLQAKINPLGKVLENITASTTIFKNNPILEFTKQRRQLYDSLQGSHWTETIIRLNNIYSKIDCQNGICQTTNHYTNTDCVCRKYKHHLPRPK